jgi:hypothetical protein
MLLVLIEILDSITGKIDWRLPEMEAEADIINRSE